MSDKLDEKAYAAADAAYLQPVDGGGYKPSLRAAITAYLAACPDHIVDVNKMVPGSTGAAEGWRDIASAPKEGSQFLTFARDKHGIEYMAVAQWAEPDGMGSVSGWFWTYAIRPTHWRPLPAPPSALSAAGKSDD